MSKPRKLANFTDKNLDQQVVELCNAHVLPDLGGSGRKWTITGVTVTTGDDGKEYLALEFKEQ